MGFRRSLSKPTVRVASNGASNLADRNAMHHFHPELALRGQAQLPGVVSKRRTPQETTVVRIALTGGPCAGKSSSLDHLVREATALGFDVYCAPESATLLFNS